MDQIVNRSLYRAAAEGDSASLLNLLGSNPHLLDKYIEAGPYTETPLHIAALLGHTEFAEVIVDRKPELASKLDPQRSSPLHLAAAEGHLDIVKKLLVFDPGMCFVRDCRGRNPLHLAATRGHVDVLKELMRERLVAARDRTGNGETTLHLCVKHMKWECLEALMEKVNDHELVNSKDYDGNTILHRAAANGQKEMMQFLIRNTGVEVHSPNLNGFTAFNILARVESGEDTLPMENNGYLHSPGEGGHEASHILSSGLDHDATKPGVDRGWLGQKHSVLMVVASLLATMAFQAAIKPPGGATGLANEDPWTYSLFVIFNTISFVASLTIILLLISGIPMLKRKAFTWVLIVTMWIAICSTSLTYTVSLLASSGYASPAPLAALLIWSLLMLLLLPGHLIKLLVKFIRRTIMRVRTNNHTADV